MVFSQNLILNPGAELPPIGNGWTEGIVNPSNPVTSFHWTNANASTGGVAPRSGTQHFYAGDNSNGNYYLYQDVNVSSYSGAIDGGTASFQFSYWFRTYNFNNDRGRVTVQYLDASNTVLTAYNSPNLTNLFSWTTYSDTRTAPIGTRTIRISLYADRISGTAADAYFDDLLLTTTAPLPLEWLRLTGEFLSSGKALIQWSTSSSKEVKYYVLYEENEVGERTALDTIPVGYTYQNTTQQYNHLIQPTLRHQSYVNITLTTISFDGTETLAGQLIVNILPGSVLLFPNPCSKSDIVHFISDTHYSIRILNLLGEVRYIGNSAFPIQTEGWSAGLYVIYCIDAPLAPLKLVIE